MYTEDYEIWLEGVERKQYPQNVLPTEIETLIIGGGITGVTTAYLLSKVGKKVLLLEKRKLGEWVTDCTTGFLVGDVDIGPIELIDLFGIEKAKLILESHKKAIDDIEKIIVSENIECEFERCTNYIYANNNSEEKALKKRKDAYEKLGVTVKYRKDNNMKFNSLGYIEMPNQAKFHVIKYLTSLAKLAVKNGAVVAEDMEVISLQNKNIVVEAKIKNGQIITTKKVISATYGPFGQSELEHRYNMYRSYVVEYKIPANIFSSGLYQDNLDPYHYFRIDKRNNFDRLIIGGNDHLNILNLDHEIGHKVIQDYVKKLFKNNTFEEVRHWSGLISEPVNEIANIGEYKGQNIFYAFGFNGSGMTYSYIAGKIFLDQITGKENPYTEIYKISEKISWWKKIF